MPDISNKNHEKEKKRLYDINYRYNNKDILKDKSGKYYSTTRVYRFKLNPQKYLWGVAKTRAKQRNIEFNIKIEDVIIPEHCPILGFKLEKGTGYRDNSLSLDRVDNSKGYIKNNVRVISRKANLIKSALTIEMTEKILKYMKGEI